ncbi:MAG: hypothetical protein QXP52_02615 [Candidatus Aenigmatarchaeota archaeon]
MRKKSVKKIKIRINLYLLVFIVSIISVSLAVYFIIKSFNFEYQKRFFYDYKGYLIQFRRPIDLSYKISILPNEDSLSISTFLLSTGYYKNLTFIIFENDDNSATAIEALEIFYKVKRVLEFELNKYSEFNLVTNVEHIKYSVEELKLNNETYYIFLRSYLISNETYIKVHNVNFVEITGKNLEEFDLATIRFLISFLDNMKKIYK